MLSTANTAMPADAQRTRRPKTARLGLLFWAFAAILILVFSNRRSPDVTTGKFYEAAAVIAVLMLIACNALRLRGRLPPPLLWLGAFVLICVLNFPVTLVQGVPLVEWEREALPMLCLPGFAFGAYLLNARAARALYWVIAAVCGVITVYYLAFWLHNTSYTALRAAYNLGFWTGSGQTFASVIAACILFPFATRAGRRWSAMAFVVALASVAASFARTFWLVAPIALLVTGMLAAKRGVLETRRLILLAILTAVLAAAVGGVLFSVLTVRTGAGQQSGTERVLESQAIWSAMRADPMTFALGAGTGSAFQFASGGAASIGGDIAGTDNRDFSHDWYLELLWRTGVIGLAVWAGALVAWLRFTWRGRSPHAVGCFAAVLAVSLGAFTYQPFSDLGWDVLTGLVLGLGIRLAREPGLVSWA
jgi:O-antigen ligase